MLTFHTFDRSEGQLLTLGRHRFFIFSDPEGSEHIIPDRCPHRGGPLSMGSWDAETCKLTCPWHNRSWPASTLIKKELPTIRVSGKWTVYLGAAASNETCRVHDIPVVNVDHAPTGLQ